MSSIDFAVAPLGPVYFGDGRPNTAGEPDYRAGRFPPSPRTAQGIVRSALLRSVPGLVLGHGADRRRIESLVGPPEQLLEGWQVTGPWPARWREGADGRAQEVEPWLSLPRYVVAESPVVSSRSRGHETRALQKRPTFLRPKKLEEHQRWDLSLSPSPRFALLGDRHEAGFVSPAAVAKILSGTAPDGGSIGWDTPKFVAKEARVGIQVDSGRGVARDHMLYALDYYRFGDQSGFVVRFRGEIGGEMDDSALIQGATPLGGKNRLARLLAVDSWCPEFDDVLSGKHLPVDVEDGTQFWIWTTTPAPVSSPWAPGFVVPRGNVRIEVLAAAVGPTDTVGGFSLAAARSHEALPCIAAGAAWLVELRGGTPRERGTLVRSLHDAFPLDIDPDLRSMGFGHTLISNVSRSGA